MKDSENPDSGILAGEIQIRSGRDSLLKAEAVKFLAVRNGTKRSGSGHEKPGLYEPLKVLIN